MPDLVSDPVGQIHPHFRLSADMRAGVNRALSAAHVRAWPCFVVGDSAYDLGPSRIMPILTPKGDQRPTQPALLTESWQRVLLRQTLCFPTWNGRTDRHVEHGQDTDPSYVTLVSSSSCAVFIIHPPPLILVSIGLYCLCGVLVSIVAYAQARRAASVAAEAAKI